jgi:tripartite-type tricarboxylate transporter receptor subunit TctC
VRTRRLAAWLLLLAAAPAAAEPRSEPGDAFFEGKTLTYVVGSKIGGGYDTYARLIARHLDRHLTVARIVVRNLPGAGSIRALNQVYHEAPDGLTICTFNTGLIYAQLQQREGIRFDLLELSWIGKAGGEPRVFVVPSQLPLRSVEDLRSAEEPVLVATSGIGSASHSEAVLLSRVLGFRARMVTGYSGGEKLAALLRGEVDGFFGSFSSLRNFVESGGGRILFHVAGEGRLDPSTPSARSLASRDDADAVLEVLEANAELGRMTVGPPGVPSERLRALRRAYLATLSDPQLLREAAKLRIPIVPMGGAELEARVARALDQPPETLALLRADIR